MIYIALGICLFCVLSFVIDRHTGKNLARLLLVLGGLLALAAYLGWQLILKTQ